MARLPLEVGLFHSPRTSRSPRTHATHLDTLCLCRLASIPLSLVSCLSRLVSCLSCFVSALLLSSVCLVLFFCFSAVCPSVSLCLCLCLSVCLSRMCLWWSVLQKGQPGESLMEVRFDADEQIVRCPVLFVSFLRLSVCPSVCVDLCLSTSICVCGRRTATEQKLTHSQGSRTRSIRWKRTSPGCNQKTPPVPVTEQIVQEIKSLHPTDPEPPAPAQTIVSDLVLSEVAELIPTTLHKMPRPSEPVPLGMRAEH